MARSTGPVLAAGAITIGNRVVLNGESVDWRIPIATGVVAGMLALFEKGIPELAVGLAWAALITIMVTRTDPTIPSPAESFTKWWNEK